MPVSIIAGAIIVALIGVGAADVVLQYQAQTRVSGTGSPFKFVNGANYVAANSQALITTTYPNAQQVALSSAVSGASGAYGTYLLDVVELKANASSAAAWHLRIDVTTALVAPGVNAAYLFYCSLNPSAVPDSGASLAQGTDANGNPWAVFAPTCAGTQGSLSLLSTGAGPATVNLVGLTSGTTLLYLSYGLAITNTGARTTTASVATLVATSP
ncbi:MAG: hypothetical protein L3J91_01140 [Thermoplasmata archaeon]|nr:hypothetical protein [Thermoplasmata archaeon]